MTLVQIYTGLKDHDYVEEDGHVTHDHCSGFQDAFWITVIMFGIFVIGGCL
jgi:hypothetical protein